MQMDSSNSSPQLEQLVAQLVRLLRAHARRRLVEQQEVGVGRERGRELDLLERAVRQPLHGRVAQVAEREDLEDGVGPAAQLCSLAMLAGLPSMPDTAP